jgi:hypothetical protein
MVYIHIARMTAESGHWLPLQSEIVDTRNTKPPLLFWQAMAAGGWGHHWSLFALRLPSMHVHLCHDRAGGLFRAPHQWPSIQTHNACLAAGAVPCCFSPPSGMAGLPDLGARDLLAGLAHVVAAVGCTCVMPGSAPTNPRAGALATTPCSVWPWAWAAPTSLLRWLAPAAAALWCAVLLSAQSCAGACILRTTLGVGWSTALALGIFALWFVLDPTRLPCGRSLCWPRTPARCPTPRATGTRRFFGTTPMWTQLLAYPANAGLLFFAVLAWAWVGRVAFKRQTYAHSPRRNAILLVWLAGVAGCVHHSQPAFRALPDSRHARCWPLPWPWRGSKIATHRVLDHAGPAAIPALVHAGALAG